jgi:WD repeat-containing protein 90|tara:strand:+ start:1659 stop:2696 length:1038 start_codon:yes stop_codon:yes gene_type:complete
MMTVPVISLKCLSFSHDGRYLASVGKDKHNKELICVWDISRITRGEMPEICARQTSEFNILSLKFSPIDSSRLASCGKENIRFWRVRETGNIRGSAVVLQHHARNTVFTCLDFEYGFRSADRSENESLKRVFVGSKHGMVFQVNYQNETLEASYKTNDGAIFAIAVNDAFCVLGSEDTYVRVWPLDFQEFFMEAQHEGTVSAVDISPDGLKVVCGTLYGSIGILDKSNQNYKTLLRSHTDEILAMDFHVQKQHIITVSKDKTIRLWDIQSNDEVYEFSSPVDQPLCVAAHPQQAIFACGFESGKMRIFDIDTTEVLDEFSQFNKPLKSVRYDNSGKLLIACCQDG